ncbi:hypothetical protein BH09PSE4_BH09PSE4_21550 [soil metagenome]
MIARHFLLALLLLPAAAHADTQRETIGSFDRVRIAGPFEVRIATGKSPSALVDADRDTLDLVTTRLDGTTLVVGFGNSGWGEQARSPKGVVTVTLSTPALRAVVVTAGARVTIAGMKGQRVDLSVNGTGTLSATGVSADELYATLIGSGSIALSGSSRRAQLVSSGAGTIDATGLLANDLTVRLDGSGETRAAARSTAKVTTTGMGGVTVLGTPSCVVKAMAGGPVTCGGKD